jgi:ribokinase
MTTTTQKIWDVITVGDVFVDIVMSGFATMPKFGEEVECERLQYEAGGGAAITACGLAKLGCRTALLAVVGQADSDWFHRRVQDCGVDLSHLVLHEREPTATTVSVSTNVDRAFFTYRGANKLLPELFADPTFQQTMQQARHVHVAHALAPDTLLALATELHDAGTTLSLDVGWNEEWLRDEQSLHALKMVDIFFPNEREAELMTKQTETEMMLQAFADAGLPTVALKLGANGSALLYGGKLYFATPHNVTAMDTTGAGDCFDAGFLYAWLGGNAPTKCVRIANYCGAHSTQALGGIHAFPLLQQLPPDKVHLPLVLE